ncbi:MAG TPA: hypothetical protein VN894_13250 [Polyangiaceae bacterium]|nr:hypothetical protein [Polyangiaceae bacterium]
MRADWRLRMLICAGTMFFLCGCPNPNTYTVPRTLDPGGFQFSVAPEVYGFSLKTNTPIDNAGNVTSATSTASFFSPTLPTVGIRYGVVNNFEIGARAPNLDSLAFDGKVQFVRGAVDLAVDPGAQAFFVGSTDGSVGVFYLHLPLMVGLNLSDKVTLVAAPGIVYTVATATVNASNSSQQAASASGVMARLSVGVDIRVAKRIALHPELTFLRAFDSTETLLYIFGFGLNFGAMPNYSDIGR